MGSTDLFQEILLSKDKEIYHRLVSKNYLTKASILVEPVSLTFHNYPVFVSSQENVILEEFLGKKISFKLTLSAFSEDGLVEFLRDQESSRSLLLMSDMITNISESILKFNFEFQDLACDPEKNLINICFESKNNNLENLCARLIGVFYLCDWVFFVRGLVIKNKYLTSRNNNLEFISCYLSNIPGFKKN